MAEKRFDRRTLLIKAGAGVAALALAACAPQVIKEIAPVDLEKIRRLQGYAAQLRKEGRLTETGREELERLANDPSQPEEIKRQARWSIDNGIVPGRIVYAGTRGSFGPYDPAENGSNPSRNLQWGPASGYALVTEVEAVTNKGQLVGQKLHDVWARAVYDVRAVDQQGRLGGIEGQTAWHVSTTLREVKQ